MHLYYTLFQHCVGDLHPVKMEGSVQHQTPVFVQLHGVAPDVQQVLQKKLSRACKSGFAQLIGDYSEDHKS